jgi:SAM-dependent methyltransferase
MKHIFATRPIGEFADYSASHLGAGERYHKRFVVHPGRALMWELEQAALRDIVGALKPRRILDFACGTGRIASFLENTFAEPAIDGIDISESMITLAREKAVRVNYRLMDTQQAISVFGERHFDLITAFRFFANAEHSLRERIAGDLARLVSDDGALVINNHRNFWSTSYIARRLKGEKPIGALNSDIEGLFTGQGFRVMRKLSLGLWPQGDTQALMLPWKAVRALERRNLDWLAAGHALGYNTVWVLSRARTGEQPCA